MSTISVTRFRARSIWIIPLFLLAPKRIIAQVRKSRGFMSGVLLLENGLSFWTMTCWSDSTSMRNFTTSGMHLRIMPMMARWACEAASVTWQQKGEDLPDWAEAFGRMRSEGRPIYVPHPSSGHSSLAFSTPSSMKAVPIVPARPHPWLDRQK